MERSLESAQVSTHASDLASRGRRLFEYLAATQQLKRPPRLDTDGYDHVFWLGSMPDHAAVEKRPDCTDAAPDESVLCVRRLPMPDDPPQAPERLYGWLDGAGKKPESRPTLLPEIPDPLGGARDECESRLQLADHPDIQATYDGWIASWDRWADKIRAEVPVRNLYKRLFAAADLATSQIDEYECVIAVGQLDWTPNADAGRHVSRHLLTCPASIEHDDTTGAITIRPDPSNDSLVLELDMLDPSLTRHPVFDEVREAARGFAHHPLDPTEVGRLVRRVVNTMDPDATYTDNPQKLGRRDAPRAAFAPAVIVRRRSAHGLIRVFQDIASTITSTGRVPPGLLPLVDPDSEPPSEPDGTPGAIASIDGDTFLPLPLNDRQLEVIRRADSHAQTLVQGPPGTGKTHTAAALVTHLLAQGKRVLVTAQTDRALKEVRGKLPEEIRPLAVSIVGADRLEMANLKKAVAELSTRSSDHVPAESDTRIRKLVDRIDELRRERARLRRDVVEARAAEMANHSFAGSSGTLARLAESYQASTQSYAWITSFVDSRPEDVSSVSDEQAVRWFDLLHDEAVSNDEPESLGRVPDLTELPDPAEFADLVDSEATGEAAASEHTDVRGHAAYDTVKALDPDSRADLRVRMQQIAHEAGELEQRTGQWLNAALHDVRTGRGSTWQDRASNIAALIDSARPYVESLGPATDVAIASGSDLGALVPMAQQLFNHVRDSGPLKAGPDGSPKIGAFTNKTVKTSQPFLASVRVNGRAATSADSIAAFLNYAEGDRLLNALDRAWPADVTIPAEDTLRERLQWHVTELEQLRHVLGLGSLLVEAESTLRASGVPRPDWNDIETVIAFARLVDAAAAHERYAEAAQPLMDLERSLASITEWSDAATTTLRLRDAVRSRERDAYARAHERLVRLHHVRRLVAERDDLSAAIDTAFPGIESAIRSADSAGNWRERLADVERAWDWARTGAWLRAQESVDINVLHAQVDAVEGSLRATLESLAATRAWAHAVSTDRLTGRSRADLAQYSQLVRKLGKGTGKYAPKLRGEIRQAMDRCRPAVPVWIMPIYRISEQLTVSEDMFDVVIVDEASQAGLEAAFLQYLAPKIVVIGDDKQVSPTAVGVNQAEFDALANQYLSDNRYKSSWKNPQLSLFDLAAQRFRKITLVEHRRCVPEIIGFSNRIAYEPENIRLIPVRQFGADRLEPIRTVHIADGYEQGSSSNKVNPAEADAIVEQVLKCLADPQYDNKTFGVISLIGSRQAQQIQSRLLDAVPPKEWEARQLRCGDAAAFQGSERDVMFLSMVSAPDEERRLGSLSRELYLQRFNVAVSRAKDQVWVFHTVTLEDVPNSEDMRHKLLAYCHEVEARELGEAPVSEPVSDDVREERFDSLFEQRVYNRIVERGFIVEPQFEVNGRRIDLVVVGATTRLAIECDGDAWHGPEQFEHDVARQRELERCGWTFFRIRESQWYTDPASTLGALWEKLDELDICPGGVRAPVKPTEADAPSLEDGDSEPAGVALAEVEASLAPGVEVDNDVDREYSGRHRGSVVEEPSSAEADLPPYEVFDGSVPPLLDSERSAVAAALVEVVRVEGPVTGARLHRAYVTAGGGRRVGKRLAHALNSALSSAVRRGLIRADNPLGAPGLKQRTFSLDGQPADRVRDLGPRALEEVPPDELARVMCDCARDTGWEDSDALLRAVLHRLGRNRLTGPASATLEAVLPLARSLGEGDDPSTDPRP